MNIGSRINGGNKKGQYLSPDSPLCFYQMFFAVTEISKNPVNSTSTPKIFFWPSMNMYYLAHITPAVREMFKFFSSLLKLDLN